MKTISCVFAALCLINTSIASGQMTSPQKCADLGISAMQNFQKERQMGIWYCQEETLWPPAANGDCFTATYVAVGNTAVITDTYHVLDLKLKTSLVGLATYNGTSGVYKYVSTDNSGFNATITILSTDYDNYTVEWLCSDVGDHSESIVYVMTRNRSVPSTIQQKITKVLADNNIDETKMKKFKQDVNTCVYGLSGGLLGGLLGALLKLVGGLLG